MYIPAISRFDIVPIAIRYRWRDPSVGRVLQVVSLVVATRVGCAEHERTYTVCTWILSTHPRFTGSTYLSLCRARHAKCAVNAEQHETTPRYPPWWPSHGHCTHHLRRSRHALP